VFYLLIHCFVCLMLDMLAAAGVAAHENDLEIALLRQQLRVLERKLDSKPSLSRPEKLMLLALSNRLKRVNHNWRDRLRQCLLLVKPDTLLKWHRQLVRRKWTFQSPNLGGRPRLNAALEALIVRLVRENPRSGLTKIADELLKLGYAVDRTTIRNVMRRHHLPPAPERGRSSWRTFLNHYQTQMLACDFFTVETITLQTCISSFSLNWARHGSIWRAARLHPIVPGLPSKRVNSCGTSAMNLRQCAFSCMTVSPSSRSPSTRFLFRRASKSSGHPFMRPKPMQCLSVGCEVFARNVWIIC